MAGAGGRRAGCPASIVLTDEALVAVEERRPATEADLRDIPGFRPDKIATYGSRVLAIVAEAATPEAGPFEPAGPKAAQPAPPGAAHGEETEPGAALAEVGKAEGGQPESD